MIPTETFAAEGTKGHPMWADGRLDAPCETIRPIRLEGVAAVPFNATSVAMNDDNITIGPVHPLPPPGPLGGRCRAAAYALTQSFVTKLW